MTTETEQTRRPLRYRRTLALGLILVILAYGASDAIRFVYQAY